MHAACDEESNLARLDPQLEKLLSSAPATSVDELTASAVRRDDLAVLELQCPPAALYDVEDVALPVSRHLPARVYRPSPGLLPLLVYFHGGGFVIGGAAYDRPLRELALATGCVVVAPEVRLAPEHRFPAAVEDALGCARWLYHNAAALAGTNGSFGIAGDSSGGNLAAIATRELSRGGLAVDFQVLIYPMLDATTDSDSFREYATGYGFTREKSLWYFDQYLPAGSDRHDPRISPRFERDLTGLPPTLVITAEYDPLRDDGEGYARSIDTAGGDATVFRYEGMVHGFFQMSAIVDAARQVQLDVASWIKTHNHPGGSDHDI